MKKLPYFLCYLLAFVFNQNVYSQYLDFTLKYNIDSSYYEVYAAPAVTISDFHVGGGSQLSIVLPASIPDVPLTINTVAGGIWGDNSQIFAPAVAINNDFHSITADGSSTIDLEAGKELLLFTFQIPTEDCVTAVRLFENTTDPQADDNGMYGADFRNYFADAGTLINYFRATYNNEGISCDFHPTAMDTMIVFSGDTAIVIPIDEIIQNPDGDSFFVSIITPPLHGTATIDTQNVQITYMPNNDGQNNSDLIEYVICDLTNVCDTAIIFIFDPKDITPTPEIIDPCNCLANASNFGAGDGQFSEIVTVKSQPGETWRVSSINGLYQNPTAPVFPPPSGRSTPYAQIPFTIGTVLTETKINDLESRYVLQGIHIDNIGYQVTVTNGTESLTIGNTCQYDVSCGFNIVTDPDGTPGQPTANGDAGVFIIPTGTAAFIDTLKSCDATRNTFMDDGLVDGLYQDTASRNNIITLCPQNQWQNINVVFSEFDVAAGDTLIAYDGTSVTDSILAKMSGTGVSQANGAWVAASCNIAKNPHGCLTFQFKTNGDNVKGTGWLASVACSDSNIELNPPNDLNATLTCTAISNTFTINPATVTADCGTIRDSQIIRIYNPQGQVCQDTCVAFDESFPIEVAIGSYRVQYKLKSDTTKMEDAILTVQAPNLACNDAINVPLGSGCSVLLTPDDLLENPCDTITDTMYYYITLIYIDEKGKTKQVAGGGKGGAYPILTREMLGTCGGTIKATIERRYFEGLNLNICNNGQVSASCETIVNVTDQMPPIFTDLAAIDTFVTCAIDLTQEGLGLPLPKAIDNCGAATVTFAGAIVADATSEICDTTKAKVTWKAVDNCGNETEVMQQVVFVRPRLADIVKTGKVTLACDSEIGKDDITVMPSIQIGKLKNGVLIPSDTIPLSTDAYTCGYILQKQDVEIPALASRPVGTGCGRKVFRYWTLVDWCDPNGGVQPIDTTFIEYQDTEAPEFITGTAQNKIIELDHFSCTYDITKADKPQAKDNCSIPTVRLAKVSRIEDATLWEIPVADWANLGADSFQLEWVAEDACKEQLINDTLFQIIEIKDQTKPSAICTDKINVSIGRNEVQLHYADIDAGSNDACGIAKYEVSRDEINWDSVVTFNCKDLHQDNKVYLRVTDTNGNQNTCWMTVVVEDKIRPICADLSDQTITCDEDHFNTLTSTDTDEDKKMEDSEWIDMEPDLAAYFNTKYGNPYCSDNIDCSDLVIQQQYQFIEKSCGEGTIKRRYRAIDWNGEGLTSNWAVQTIHIEAKADWTITLPADWQGACGDEVPNSTITIVNGACDLMAYEVDEKVFSVADGACMKVIRTFSIINWCKYEAGGVTKTIARVENEHGAVTTPIVLTEEGYEEVGRLEYVQILKLEDKIAPIIVVDSIDACLEAEDCGANKTFSISANDCNEAVSENLVYSWTINVGDTQLASGQGASFNYPVAPKVTYTVNWTVQDLCGNTAREAIDYEFQDCKKPAPYCLHGVAVDLMEDVGTVQIWAADLNLNSTDNCTNKDKLTFRIWHASLGVAPNQFSEVLALPEVLTFDCTTLGNQIVNLYIIDEDNNWDYCETYVNVQDNLAQCEGNEETMAMVSGTIMDWQQRTVEKVTVTASSETMTVDYETQADGHFHLPLAMYDDYAVVPEKTDDPLNGVSTFDLVLISKHILGVQKFDNPYQMIAADVNKSGTITAFDMVQTRQLILAITNKFNNNTSWRFVDATYEFTTDNPMTEDFPEMGTIANLDQDKQLDFVAIKIGDVNGNARPHSLLAAEDRTTKGAFEITVVDKALEAGKSYTLDFTTEQLATIQGYQFTLGYKNLDINRLKRGEVGYENFGLQKMNQGVITTSWNQSTGNWQRVTGNRQPTTVLFTLEFTAQQNGQLSEQLSLLNRPTAIEAYNQNGALMDVELTFITPSDADEFELFQNHPNPFQDKTMIGFYLPDDSEIQLIIRDEMGRLLKSLKENQKAGYNTIQLNKEELTAGVIYYQLSTKFGTKVKKMLLTR